MECPCDCQGYLDERCRKGRGMCGREGIEICPYCGGEGSDEVAKPQRDDPYYAVVVTCSECNGSGYVWADPDAAKNDPMRHVEFPFAENH